MTDNVFTKADLDNIDYEATSHVFGLWTIKKDADNDCGSFLRGSFGFFLKDGRKFYCKQDLSHVFTIHSEKYGDIEGDFWIKLAADAINDNDKFVTIIETIKNVSDYAVDYCYDVPGTDEFIIDGMAQILVRYYREKHTTLFRELIKMGLDKNNKFVTISLATNKN